MRANASVALLRAALGAATGIATLFVVEWLLAGLGYDFEPVRSYANADEVLERTEFRTRVRTNAQGFRETRAPGPPDAATTRVVVLGDSFTQGFGVEEDQRYTHYLEAALWRRHGRPIEVINLGVPGASPADYLYYLREAALAYDPDVVLIGVMGNDVNDTRSLFEHGARGVFGTLRTVKTRLADDRPLWKRLPQQVWPVLYEHAGAAARRLGSDDATTSPSPAAPPGPGTRADAPRSLLPESLWRTAMLELGEAYGRRAEVAARLEELSPEREAELRDVVTGRWDPESNADRSPLWHLLAMVEPRVYVDAFLLPPAYEAAWARTAELLVETAETARRAGAQPAFAYIPAAQQVTPDVRGFLEANGLVWDERLLTDTTLPDRLAGLASRHGIPFIDLLPPLRRAQPGGVPLYFIEDGHWTPAGHAIAAATLAEQLPLPPPDG